MATAHYEMVGSGRTTHAESIEITSGTLLKVFFAVAHDPTQVNRQGPIWGTQYRSNISYVDAEQKKIAESYADVVVNSVPKVKKLKEQFPELLKK